MLCPEEMGDINTQIAFKEKRITAAANMKNVLACDEIKNIQVQNIMQKIFITSNIAKIYTQ